MEPDRGASWVPPYCYVSYGSLKLNSVGTNTGGCTSGYYGETRALEELEGDDFGAADATK